MPTWSATAKFYQVCSNIEKPFLAATECFIGTILATKVVPIPPFHSLFLSLPIVFVYSLSVDSLEFIWYDTVRECDCKRDTEITYHLVKILIIKVDATPIITESYTLADIHLRPHFPWNLPPSNSPGHQTPSPPPAWAPIPRHTNFTNTEHTHSYPPKSALCQPQYF